MNQSTLPSAFKSLVVGGWLVAALLGIGCGEPQSSSSTNWLRCATDDDCASVAGAVCRSDSICVDTSGYPIPASAAGVGSSGAGGQDATAGTTAGGSSAGGSVVMGGAGGGTDAAAGAAGAAGGVGLDGCPEGPPPANTACSPDGLECEYAGSSVGIVATCTDGVWVSMSGGGNPTYVCPSTLPAAGSACPEPPTPAYSPLVCVYDCAQNFCQGQTGTGCGAYQTDCAANEQTGEWLWTSKIGLSCTL